MKRQFALVAGAAAAAVVAALVLAPGVARARSDHDDDKDKTVEKHVVVRHAGGGRLGVSIEDPKGDARGASVRSVEADSPAEKAGLKEGDVIVRFDGEAVRSAAQLGRLVAETPAGRAIAIEVARGGASEKLSATLAERGRGFRIHPGDGNDFELEVPEWSGPPEPPEAPMAPHTPLPPKPPRAPRPFAWSWNDDDGFMVHRLLGGGPRKLGIEYMEIGDQLAAYFKLPAKSGVLVTSVDADGPAAKAGLKAGDVVTKVGADVIADGDDLRRAMSHAEGGAQVTVTVHRDGHPLELKPTLAKPEPPVRRREARGGVSL